MGLLNKLDKKFHNWGIPHITINLVIGQSLVYLLVMTERISLGFLYLIPARVLEGEVWRLFTFVLIPPRTSPIFIVFALYIFYLMGTALENYWGVFRYNLFLLIAYIATILVSFLTPTSPSTNLFIGGSVFLAFAYLNPDFQLLLFFLIPVKVKWLALLTWIGYAFTVIFGSWTARLSVLASISNFLIFFGHDIILTMRARQRRMEIKAREFAAQHAPIHQCTTCGVTDKDDPSIEFRYCTKCTETLCYCQDHIRNHEHIVG